MTFFVFLYSMPSSGVYKRFVLYKYFNTIVNENSVLYIITSYSLNLKTENGKRHSMYITKISQTQRNTDVGFWHPPVGGKLLETEDWNVTKNSATCSL